MENLEIMCAADGPAKCSFGPWRGTREEGWCDFFNMKQPYRLPPGKVCKYADGKESVAAAQNIADIRHTASNRQRDAMPQIELDFGGVFDGFSVQSDADPGL
jgi:hypothetical protein